MYTEERKIYLIEALLKVKSEAILRELENVLCKSKKKKQKKISAYNFLGLWNKKDVRLIERAIEEDCEQIHKDDWE